MWPFSAHTAGPVVRLADIPSTQTATFNAMWQVRHYTCHCSEAVEASQDHYDSLPFAQCRRLSSQRQVR